MMTCEAVAQRALAGEVVGRDDALVLTMLAEIDALLFDERDDTLDVCPTPPSRSTRDSQMTPPSRFWRTLWRLAGG